MNLVVNGKSHRHDGGGSIAGLLAEFHANPQLVAIMINGEVVPRIRWESVTLSERDEVELLSFVAGG